MTHKAQLYTCHEGYVQCGLCAHGCRIEEGRRGLCQVRENRGGELYSMVYGQIVAEHVDPVEKKPLFHVQPGSYTYSISTRGCNFRCKHCQNASISQVARTEDPALHCKTMTCDQVVERAIDSGCTSISYTYVEPTVFFEFAVDCSELALERGLANLFVSNGYMSGEATRRLAPLLLGINIDCKSFSDDFYRSVCGARLQPVLDTISLMVELGVWVEVTTLLIPGRNDSVEELRKTASFLVALDPSIPWHVTAFHPTYKMTDVPPTSLANLEMAARIGRDAGLLHVYAGNIPGSGGEDTICPSCGVTLIQRYGFRIVADRLDNGRCPDCSAAIAGRWVNPVS